MKGFPDEAQRTDESSPSPLLEQLLHNWIPLNQEVLWRNHIIAREHQQKFIVLHIFSSDWWFHVDLNLQVQTSD